MASLAIITPNWLKVDRAIIFFMSHSDVALMPAMSIVKEAVIIRNKKNSLKLDNRGKNRSKRKIPAVTRVDE